LKSGKEKVYPYVLTAKASSKKVEGVHSLTVLLIENGKELSSANKDYFAKSILQLKRAPGKITVDGNSDEWENISGGNVSKYKNVIAGRKRTGVPDSTYAHWLGEDDLSYTVKTTWDDRSLYFLINVIDGLDTPTACPEATMDAHPWNYDCVEIFLNLNNDQSSADSMDSMTQAGQIMIFPVFAEKARTCKKVSTTSFFEREAGVITKFVGRKTQKGYLIEGRVTPGKTFSLEPGAFIGLDIAVDDHDDKRNIRKSQLALHAKGTRNFRKPSSWGKYKLSK
jgi:cellulose/xylan binding protein with CBM9 domain